MLCNVPDSFVSASEKCGGVGTFMSMLSNGKYSELGSPPPSEMIPGCLR